MFKIFPNISEYFQISLYLYRMLKQSIKQYRNIAGVRFECFTTNPLEFEAVRKEAKLFKIKTRLIDGQLYREIKK